jgi:hypothetical protein
MAGVFCHGEQAAQQQQSRHEASGGERDMLKVFSDENKSRT